MAGSPEPHVSHDSPEARVRLDAPKLALAVKAVIAQRHLKHAEAAREIGIPNSRMSELLNGSANPGAPVLLAVLAWLHMDPAEFSIRIESPPAGRYKQLVA